MTSLTEQSQKASLDQSRQTDIVLLELQTFCKNRFMAKYAII